ncbi:hypothetical protein O181_048033 [Austropuccinia psidii MF-1]|uniref:Uncharacterized protein n=1 Tax=Austropuccinia psidii MF-1 TaxID=1389203 RepID=A0A9Q3DX76_9BASI|nr:hypothetical protein [Austropuccinia psidii MF-1]
MRQEHGKHYSLLWKSEIITKWATIPGDLKWKILFIVPFLAHIRINHLLGSSNKKNLFSALHPDMSYSMINMKILRKFGGVLEHLIKCRFLEPCLTEDCINAITDIITKTRIGKPWTETPMKSKIVPKTSREDRIAERPVIKCHKCARTSRLANTCTKNTKINEVQVIEEAQCDK